MIFHSLGSTVRHLTTSAINLSLREEANCSTLPFCLPVLQVTNVSCSMLWNNQKWCAYSASVALGPSFPFLCFFFFFLIYVCSHYIPYYFFLTLLSLYLIWLHCDIKLFKCISLNIWPLATCLVSIFFFVLHFLFPTLFCYSIYL